MNNFCDIIKEIVLLYELSLGIGKSLDMEEECQSFVQILLTRKKLDFASVWLKDEEEPEYSLVYGKPKFRINIERIGVDNIIFKLLEAKDYYSVASGSEIFQQLILEKDVTEGVYIIYKLEDIGILKLYGSRRKEGFSQKELKQLKDVVKKFATSLKACILHEKLIKEINARKNTEKDLKNAKEAAEAANKTKSQFLANMSHEIRTPMNGILGMTEMLLTSSLNKEQKNYVEIIKTSSEALLTIINDVLDFSKVEAGKLELTKTRFDLIDTVEKVVDFLSIKAYKKGLEINLNIEKEVPYAVIGDPVRLRQVLINLVSNAIKFTEKGKVQVNAKLEMLKDHTASIKFSIMDTGIGIPKEKTSQIFESFSQVDGSATRRFEGTGLGLAISKQLVELMEGTIDVKSSIGKGSEFFFTIKLQLQENALELRDYKFAYIHKMDILVISENDDVCENLDNLLNNWQPKSKLIYRVNPANEGISFCFKRSFDVVLITIDALYLYEKLFYGEGFLDTSVVIITNSLAEEKKIVKILESRRADYVAKPIKPSQLLNKIIDLSRYNDNIFKNYSGLPKVFLEKGKNISSIVKNQHYKKATILLVEDNEINKKLMNLTLKNLGYEVVNAHNGKEALAILKRKKQRIHLILMDVQMPEMNGYETTAHIRNIEKTTGEHIYIVALTANAMEGEGEKCIKSGMDDYMAKPIRKQQLQEIIKKYIE